MWRPRSLRPTSSRSRGASLTLLAACLAAASAAPADAEEPTPVTATLGGVVTTSEGGAPQPGVLVEAVSRDATVGAGRTGADGRYEITGLPSRADYRLRMSGAGMETSYWVQRYGDQRVPATISVRIGERITVLDLTIRPLNARLRGRVTGLDGRPLAGVNVAEDVGGGAPPAGPLAYAPRRTTTDADGRYELLVPPGSYRMVAERPDLTRRWLGGVLHPFDPAAGFADVAQNRTREGVDFRLGPRPARSCWAVGGYWITGTVEQPDPSFPPDRDDSCGADLAPPGPLRVANEGQHVLGGQRMDMIEFMLAMGMATEFGGLTPPAVRLVGQSNAAGGIATPQPQPPKATTAPAAAPGTLATAARVPVRRGRFVATTTCPRGTRCSGTLRAVVVRSARSRTATVTVATARVAAGAGRRRTTMRLNAAGRRLLRSSGGTLRATLRWETPGAAARPARTVRLEAR